VAEIGCSGVAAKERLRWTAGYVVGRQPGRPVEKLSESDRIAVIVALRKERVNESAPADNRWRRKRLEIPGASAGQRKKRGSGRKYPPHTFAQCLPDKKSAR
jgi:hypothetical protein